MPGSARTYWDTLETCQDVLGHTGMCWDRPGCAVTHQDTLGTHQDTLGCAGTHGDTLGHTGISWDTPGQAWTRRDMPGRTRPRRDAAGHAGTRQDASCHGRPGGCRGTLWPSRASRPPRASREGVTATAGVTASAGGGGRRVLPGEEGQVVLAEATAGARGLCLGHDVLEPGGHVHLQRLVALDEVVFLRGGRG